MPEATERAKSTANQVLQLLGGPPRTPTARALQSSSMSQRAEDSPSGRTSPTRIVRKGVQGEWSALLLM